MIYSWDILDFRGKSKGYFWETLGFRGKMSQVFRRQKLKMMGYPMELLHEMIVLISKMWFLGQPFYMDTGMLND